MSTIRATLRRAALFAAAPMIMLAMQDAPPTEADQRFKAKYGIWPPHITYKERTEQDRARSSKQPKENKDNKEKTKVKQQERERQ